MRRAGRIRYSRGMSFASALKFLLKGVALFTSLIVLLYLIALMINANDVPPSEEFLRLKRAVAERPPVDDADNGFIYLLGIAAAEDELPGNVGAQRGAWLEAVNLDRSKVNSDPVSNAVDYAVGRHAGIKAMFDACSHLLDRACRTAFEAAPPVDSWSEMDRLLLQRYRELVQRPAWRDIVPTNFDTPLASYQHAIAGLRLQMLALRGADAAAKRQSLERESRFWRGMTASSDLLIEKMIGIAGVRQHLWFGNLLLRELPAAEAALAIPDEWRRELSPAELSLERALAGELAYFEGTLRDPGYVDTFDENWEDFGGSQRLDRRIGRVLMRPFYQPQDVLNHVAAEYISAAKAYEVPLAELPGAVEAWRRRPAVDPFPSRIYDATGDYVREIMLADYGSYALRAATLEGMRRATLVTVELRARGVSTTNLATELGTSTLRNPFNGHAFAWNAAEQAVEYLGPDPHQWRRGLYFY